MQIRVRACGDVGIERDAERQRRRGGDDEHRGDAQEFRIVFTRERNPV
jgi:hypothetical protein